MILVENGERNRGENVMRTGELLMMTQFVRTSYIGRNSNSQSYSK